MKRWQLVVLLAGSAVIIVAVVLGTLIGLALKVIDDWSDIDSTVPDDMPCNVLRKSGT
jgi:hypothetical protein